MASWPWALGSNPGAKLWESARCCWMKVPFAMVSLSPEWDPRAGQSWGAGIWGRSLGGPYCGGFVPTWPQFVASLTLGPLPAVKHDWTFQDRDTQFYRFPGPEPEPAGVRELEEELVEAVALLSQRGPDALLTVALRKP